MPIDTNRRNFLKGAAVGAAFLPSFNILHAEEATIGPKDDQINVALIGFGAEARVLSASLVRIPGVRVRCVCDIWKFQQQQAKSFFKNYGMPITTYEDYREMLDKEDKNIDAVAWYSMVPVKFLGKPRSSMSACTAFSTCGRRALMVASLSFALSTALNIWSMTWYLFVFIIVIV